MRNIFAKYLIASVTRDGAVITKRLFTYLTEEHIFAFQAENIVAFAAPSGVEECALVAYLLAANLAFSDKGAGVGPIARKSVAVLAYRVAGAVRARRHVTRHALRTVIGDDIVAHSADPIVKVVERCGRDARVPDERVESGNVLRFHDAPRQAELVQPISLWPAQYLRVGQEAKDVSRSHTHAAAEVYGLETPGEGSGGEVPHIVFLGREHATVQPFASERGGRSVYLDGMQTRSRALQQLRHAPVRELRRQCAFLYAQPDVGSWRPKEATRRRVGGGFRRHSSRSPPDAADGGEGEAVAHVPHEVQHQRRHALAHVEGGGGERGERRGGGVWTWGHYSSLHEAGGGALCAVTRR